MRERGFSSSGAVSIVVENLPGVYKALRDLGTRGARTAARKALRAGAAPIVKAIRIEAKTQVGKKTGRLAKSAGMRIGKNKRRGIFEAKAGLNVGKKLSSPGYAPHATAIALGTKIRATKKGQFRGKVEPHHIVPVAYAKSASQSRHEMMRKLDIEIQVETVKAYHRNKK